MLCLECRFDNRAGAKFCIECGNKLEINCSKFNHLNPSGSKFCEECGADGWVEKYEKVLATLQ